MLKSLFKRLDKSHKIKTQSILEVAEYTHVDLGCFTRPRGANIGIDAKVPPIFPEKSKFIQCNLGFDRIPLDDNSIDFVTAFDFLEHVPKSLWFISDHEKNSKVDIFNSESTENLGNITVIKPSIFLMNEIYRILKPKGQFLSYTPAISRDINQSNINCLIPINQDPTHVNTWTYEGFIGYFCPPDLNSSDRFQQQISNGIRTLFVALPWGESSRFRVEDVFHKVGHDGTHLTMILEKPEFVNSKLFF